MDRREFLQLTAAAPVLGLIPQGALQNRDGSLTECLAGNVELTAPSLDVYGPHHVFYEGVTFTSEWIRLTVVPKFKCFNNIGDGRTYYNKKNGEVALVHALLDLSLGAPGSELPYLTEMSVRNENEYIIPFMITKGSRITLRIRDEINRPTKYKVHMAVVGSN